MERETKSHDTYKRDIVREFKNDITFEGMEKLLRLTDDWFESMRKAMTRKGSRDCILILINPDKFDTDMLMDVSDDWYDYVTKELDLEPQDAMMVTPF